MRPFLLFPVLLLLGCPPASLCEEGADPAASLGAGVGGAFVAYEVDQEVPLNSAPQGGFGVTVLIQTAGLPTGGTRSADVQLNVSQDGELKGDFLSANATHTCVSEEEGGRIEGLVVGFNQSEFPTLDDFIDINGEVVDLEVTITTHEGPEAFVSHPVTLNLSR